MKEYTNRIKYPAEAVKDLYNALGLDIKQVTGITIYTKIGEAPKVVVESFLSELQSNGLVKVLTKYELKQKKQ